MKSSSQPPAASRGFWQFALVVWLLLVAALIHAGFQPDYWQLQPTPYPADSVIAFTLIILVEIVILGLIVQPWRLHHLWLRMLVCVFPWLGWTVFWAVIAMHQSPVRDVHLFWLFATSAILLLALLVVVPASLWPRLRRWLGN